MKAIQIDQTGAADVLKFRDVGEPVPGTGEVLIRVAAAGINYADIMARRGECIRDTPLPFVPGSEVAERSPPLARA